ncbi:hypothetical protein B0T10DRAFT_564214 [Thelonectria olida]|uniref:Uncharacterized protein n=1 Tax=Thelonectria olida TaxID=1576542 RepID=A0A9P8VYY8_9HYPO|nr:hypothetical protein B0T10DRAFT_564214 [Thelonectria olida]
MFKSSDYIEHSQSFDELRQHRRWLRIGYGILGLLLIWNLFLSAGLLFSPRGYMPVAEPGESHLASHNLSSDMAALSTNLEREDGTFSLETRGTGELQVREDQPVPGQFSRYTTLGLKTIAVTNIGFGMWGVFDDCRDFSDGQGVKSGVKCVYGAVSTAIGVAVGVHGFVLFAGAVRDTGLVIVNQVYKRDVEDHLSNSFKTKVRHIADWDGTMSDGTVKRDVGEPVPVFGITLNDRDMHFSLYQGADNSTRIRIGHGPGPDTESNRRLRNRNEKYNNQVFEKGGLDFVVESDGIGSNSNDLQFGPESQEDFDWIYKQVDCYLTLNSISNLIITTNPVDAMGQLNAIGGIYFQVLNNKDKITMAYGKIAPFSDTQKSMIDEMDVHEGAAPMDACLF